MKLDQFKKAAKRYARAKELPLSTAQEEFASYFGFKNLDAALKALATSASNIANTIPGNTAYPPEVKSDYFWCGLSFNEFRLLAHFLERKAFGENSHSDTGMWMNKSKDLFDAVTLAMPWIAEGVQRTTLDLRSSFTLENVEAMYISIYQKVKDGVWPLQTGRLARYLEAELPGYKVKKLLERHDLLTEKLDAAGEFGQVKRLEQGSVPHEQFSYRSVLVERIYIEPLLAIEMAGGPSCINLEDHVGKCISLTDFLKRLADRKGVPANVEYATFRQYMTVGDQASIYGTPREFVASEYA